MDNYFEEFEKYVIKSCSKENVNDLMKYFKITLNDKHVLATSYEFFKWQYYNLKKDNFNFLFCEDKEDTSILGVIGYIPNSFYDNNIKQESDYIWISNWSVQPKYRGLIGIQLLNAVLKYENTENIGAIGISDFTFKICTMLKFKANSLKHFYMAGNNVKNFELLKNYNLNRNISFKDGKYKFNHIKHIEELKIFMDFDFKTKGYFINKYEKNPFYKYYFCSIKNSLLVFRISEYNQAKLLRIVDFYGNAENLSDLYYSFQDLLNEFKCECIELYCSGIESELLFSSGFELQDNKKDIVIPYHFEPFASKNVLIEYVVNGNIPKYIFKGDGDRERPGIIKI